MLYTDCLKIHTRTFDLVWNSYPNFSDPSMVVIYLIRNCYVLWPYIPYMEYILSTLANLLVFQKGECGIWENHKCIYYSRFEVAF